MKKIICFFIGHKTQYVVDVEGMVRVPTDFCDMYFPAITHTLICKRCKKHLLIKFEAK